MITRLKPWQPALVRDIIVSRTLVTRNGQVKDPVVVNHQIKFLVTFPRWIHSQSSVRKSCGHCNWFNCDQRWTGQTRQIDRTGHRWPLIVSMPVIVSRPFSSVNKNHQLICSKLSPMVLIQSRSFFRRYEFAHRIKDDPTAPKNWFEHLTKGGGLALILFIGFAFDFHYIFNAYLPYTWVRFFYHNVYNPFYECWDGWLGIEFEPVIFDHTYYGPKKDGASKDGATGDENSDENQPIIEIGDKWVGLVMWEELMKGINYLIEDRKRARGKIE